MQAAQLLAGYSFGEADLLRRAMGKKKPEEMDPQRARFMAGAAERACRRRPPADLRRMEKFAGTASTRGTAAPTPYRLPDGVPEGEPPRWSSWPGR
jgi:DNA polymerase-3 subunit alpha